MLTSRKRVRALPLTVVSVLALAGLTACGDAGGSGSGGSGGSGDKIRVAASFYPMAWLAEKVGGTDAAVQTLAKPGAEPHDQELTARQVADVGRAKLTLYVKGVQPAVDEAVAKHAKGDKALDAASVVKTLAPPAEDEHAHEHEHGAEGHEQDHGGAGSDPHIWLDPNRMATVADALGKRLAVLDPAHAAGYQSRAAAVAKQLTDLDGQFKTGLGACKQKTIVTAHAAFGYLADRYGLKQVSIAGVDPSSEPSPKRLGELTHEIREAKATTVFTETLVSPKVAETLAREAGVKTAVLDPVEGIKEGSSDDYLSVMRKNLDTLRSSLECK
ncbi:metal ABC transporter substrate-binding protein [Actinomadura kijaniata]|uniref:metal ABC transporter substrate-binding protein n=1 Tax=Actinomadura kijaniata TaxID=46161 RepID=UPI000A03D5BB|nr:metal ABC transporter substrate-binding protein [Actinomadura kijaniata]